MNHENKERLVDQNEGKKINSFRIEAQRTQY